MYEYPRLALSDLCWKRKAFTLNWTLTTLSQKRKITSLWRENIVSQLFSFFLINSHIKKQLNSKLHRYFVINIYSHIKVQLINIGNQCLQQLFPHLHSSLSNKAIIKQSKINKTRLVTRKLMRKLRARFRLDALKWEIVFRGLEEESDCNRGQLVPGPKTCKICKKEMPTGPNK